MTSVYPLAKTSARGDTVVVGVGGMAVLRSSRGRLVTYALGSCVAVAVHDREAGIGGMAHIQLPSSALVQGGEAEPARYADLAMPMLFAEIERLGAVRTRLRVTLAGGADGACDVFAIARRNLTAVRRWLWRTGIMVAGEDTGSHGPRTMILAMADGTTLVQTPEHTVQL